MYGYTPPPPKAEDVRNWLHLTLCRITIAHTPAALDPLTAAVNDNGEKVRA